ncbi:MAG TPA: sodium:proton antiporter [Planctomycetota bacterium]|nr:sodium:proton antiporter [Planctomycetota bacterium]
MPPNLPLWTVAPFAALLLLIAFLPLAAPRFWHSNRNKLLVSLAAGLPVVIYLLAATDHGGGRMAHVALEYAAFISLLGALYVIAGGIRLKGSLAGTPLTNTAILGIGAVIASFIGTTGASMLLIRPLLRANESRVRKAHVVVFFIFIVSNTGGLLTPLGDPPLYLGFLRGVPFLWTFKLAVPWLIVNGALLAIFNFVDQWILDREERERPGAQLEDVQKIKEPLGVEGGFNFLWLGCVIALIYAAGAWGVTLLGSRDTVVLVLVGGFWALGAFSWAITRGEVRSANRFSWAPMAEVAAIFLGIFVTMEPALKLVAAEGGSLGIRQPWQFFWATGLLSSVLDNAPTYLTFTALGTAVVNAADPGAGLTPDLLEPFAGHPWGAPLLAAISCGAVFMGAMTYIGNGPNFMVKAIAEENQVAMPSFVAYMGWSVAVLIPLFVILTLVWF